MVCKRRRRAGFTLIEVLVVVAIIALLISILLPSLSKAREEARRVACAAHQQQIGRSEGMYQSQEKDWIPGSPLSTGYYFAKTNLPWYPNLPGAYKYNRFAVEWGDYVTPLRKLMHGPSSIKAPGSAADATNVRKKLIAEAMEGLFHCPSNNQIAQPWPTSGSNGWPVIRATSYLSMWTMMRAGPAMYAEAGGNSWPGTGGTPSRIAQSASWDMVVPDHYLPRHSRIGRESMKVFLADGVRFFDEASNVLTYDTNARATKGIWMATPPSTAGENGREYNLARQVSYRHGSKDAINALFFDGHVERLFVNYQGKGLTGYKGSAVHPRYYYPSGTQYKAANDPGGQALHVPLRDGTVMP